MIYNGLTNISDDTILRLKKNSNDRYGFELSKQSCFFNIWKLSYIIIFKFYHKNNHTLL